MSTPDPLAAALDALAHFVEDGWSSLPTLSLSVAENRLHARAALALVAQALTRLHDENTAIQNHEEAHRVGLANERTLRAQLAERERLLLAVRRDHIADYDCGPAPCAWCEDLMAATPAALAPEPEVGHGG